MNYSKLSILDCMEYIKNSMFIYEHFRTIVYKIHDNKTNIFPGFIFLNIVLKPSYEQPISLKYGRLQIVCSVVNIVAFCCQVLNLLCFLFLLRFLLLSFLFKTLNNF